MIIPPHKLQEFNIINLDEDWKLGTVYLAYLSPKTPQQALKLIYHGTTMGVSENWVINTRRDLTKMGYIIKIDGENKNSLYKSDIVPVANYILSHQNSKIFTQKGVETLLKSLNIFLNSQWFRSFFNEESFFSPIMYSDMTVYGPYANMYITSPSGLNQKMEIKNLSQRLSHLLYDIGYYSHNIRYDMFNTSLKRFNIHESDTELLEEITSLEDFDLILQNNKENIPSDRLILICSAIKKITKARYYGKAPLQLFKKLFQSGAGCFLPNDFVLMFRNLHRLADTQNFLDFGIVRKQMYNLSHSEDLKEIDPDCITHYLSGSRLGRDNL